MAASANHIELAPVVGEGPPIGISSIGQYAITGRSLAGGAGRKVRAARGIFLKRRLRQPQKAASVPMTTAVSEVVPQFFCFPVYALRLSSCGVVRYIGLNKIFVNFFVCFLLKDSINPRPVGAMDQNG